MFSKKNLGALFCGSGTACLRGLQKSGVNETSLAFPLSRYLGSSIETGRSYLLAGPWCSFQWCLGYAVLWKLKSRKLRFSLTARFELKLCGSQRAFSKNSFSLAMPITVIVQLSAIALALYMDSRPGTCAA